MNDDNKLPKQVKPQEFELIELLFREYISSHIARPNIEYSFQVRFQSFINQIPSYLHSSSKTGFFTHFFFGSFSSLLDTTLGQKLGIQKLHFNFDQSNHLRIVAEADDKTHVFIFTENNQKKKHNKQKKIDFTKNEWKTITGQEYTDDDDKKLEISVININKSKGSINVAVEKKNIQDGVSSEKHYHEITKQFVNKDGQYIALEDQILKLSVGETYKSERTIALILEYTKKIHDHYAGLPYGAGAKEADEHGFVAGIFNNFRYRENAHVYLEQFAGKGYADIVLLVRGADRATKSIPIIIELKADTGPGTNADDALRQVEEYTKGFQPNNMRILSLSDNILCVGVNLDMSTDSFMEMKVVKRDQVVAPLIQSITDSVKKIKDSNLDIIKQEIQSNLEKTYNTFPGTGEKSSAHYMSRFILGESLVLRDYDKHIFIYDKESYIPTSTVIDDHDTRSNKKPKIEKTVDGSNAVNSILFIPTSSANSPAILVNIIDVNRDVLVNNVRLDSGLIGNRKIVQLNIQFNIDKYKESFAEYCNIKLLKIYDSISEYNQASIQVQGKLHLIAEDISNNLLEHLQQTISSQKDLVISESHYKALIGKIGEVVYPIKSLTGRESEFQGLLEGIFKYYSDVKLSEGSERRELVLTEFQTGAGGRIDMLVQAIGSSEQDTKEYIPVGLELKYDDSIKLDSRGRRQNVDIQKILLEGQEHEVVKQLLQDQTERYSKGAAIKSITDGNKVAIIGVVFNGQAQEPSKLLLTTNKFLEANIVHSSKLYTISDINDKHEQIQEILDTHSKSIIMENYNNIDVSEIESLITLLSHSPYVQKITISNSEITKDAMTRLSNVLQNNHKITSISFINTNLDKEKAGVLINLLQQNNYIVYLDVTGSNNLDVESHKALNNLLHHNQRIHQKIKSHFPSYTVDDMSSDVFIPDWVNIRRNQIRDNNIIVQNSDDIDRCYKETALDLSNTMLEDSKIKQVVTWLTNHKDVDFLDLSNNQLSSIGVEEILDYLRSNQNKISLLDISENDIGTNSQAIIKLSSFIQLNNDLHGPVLKFLNLHDIGINYGDVYNIFRALVENTSIEHLDMSSNDLFSQIQEQDIRSIADNIAYVLCNHPVLSTLDLSNTGLTNAVIEEIVRVQKMYPISYRYTMLTELNIAGNYITQDGIESLQQLILNAQELNRLDISNNYLCTSNIHKLLNSISSTKISTLRISNIELNNDIHIISNLIKSSNIKILDISYNDIGTKAVINIFQAIYDQVQQAENKLIQLNLSGNTIDQDDTNQEQVIAAMSSALANNKVLRSLDISDMGIQDTFLSELVKQLITSNIEHLNIAGNDISEFTILELASYLKSKSPLKLLNISGYTNQEYQSLIKEPDIYNLFEALSKNSQLTHLDLSYNNLDYKSIQTISEYLQENHGLEYLSLADTNLNLDSISVLLRGLKSNSQLQYLDIRNNQPLDDHTALQILEVLKVNKELKLLFISQNNLSEYVISQLTSTSLGGTVQIDGYTHNNLLDLNYQMFESAIKLHNYNYWLQQHDIVDIGRVQYGFSDNGLEVVGSIHQLSRVINDYTFNNNNISPVTIICNIGNDNKGSNHWVSLVLNRQDTNYHGYYIDSFGRSIPSNIASILNNDHILIVSLSIPQQLDGHNCGFWALENAQKICQVLQNNANTDLDTHSLRDVLTRARSAAEWRHIRDDVYAKLINDNIRIESLRTLGLTQHAQESVISSCLAHVLRMKREIKPKCKIGWNDIDAINVNNPSRNIEEIVIDAKKFLEYSKLHVEDEVKSLQLVRLAEEIRNKGDGKIVGKYQGLLEQVIQNGGYNNYIQQSRISEIGHHVIKENSKIKVSPVLKLKLLNVAGKIQLINGVHGTIALCHNDLRSNDCILSVGALGYSFLSQPLERLMVQVVRPMVAQHAATVANKIIPKVVLFDAKFAVQIFNLQYGVKIAKGTAGAFAGALDIVDIAMSAKVLMACVERTNTNPCSSKEIRDNIASIGFSGVSFISGIVITGPYGVAMALGLVVLERTYRGISNVIEYEEKYDTTIAEDFSIFWRTVLFRNMAQDVVSLRYRSDYMNNIVQKITQFLRNNTDNVVGYTIGLGKIELQYKPLCQAKTIKVPVYCIGLRPASGPCADGKDGYIKKNITECDILSQYIPSIVQDRAFINAKHTSTNNTHQLSRVLPKPVDKMKMVCLPQATDAVYEKGIKNIHIDAQYYCDNALMIISHDTNRTVHLKNQYILYDLQYIKVGFILASNTYHNRFLINNSTINIYGGDNVKNEFIVLSNKFVGTIFLGVNSTNIIDASQLQDVKVNVSIKNLYSIADFSHVILNNIVINRPLLNNDINLYYIGRKNKIDNIECDVFSDTHINMKYYTPRSSILIDGGGGCNNTDEDLITNCNIVRIKPYTRVQGINSSYTVYIPTKEYANQSLNAIIDVYGNGTIIFPNIRLLRDTIITYAEITNTLSCKILIDNGTYTIDIRNYLNNDNKTQFVLIDRDNTNIIYQHKINNNQITKYFVLNIKCQFDTTKAVVNHYRNISDSRENYEVFGTVENKQYNHFLQFGSSGQDIIIIDHNIVYVEGNGDTDTYIVHGNSNKVIINNEAADLKLDLLQLPINSTNTIFLIKNNENLHLLFNSTKDQLQNHQYRQQEIIIEQYFQDNIYQHIAVMDLSNNTFIPFNTKNSAVKLLPFLHASIAHNTWMLRSNIQNAVIDITQENIVFYKQGNDVLLTEKQTYGLHGISVILKDYYMEKDQWLNVRLYSYNNSTQGIIDLYNIEISAISYQDQYDSVIQEYKINLNTASQTIKHNRQKLQFVIFEDMLFDRLKVTARNNDLVLLDSINNNKELLIIQDWYKHNRHQNVVFEFNSGLEADRIYMSYMIEEKINFNNKLSKEILNIDNHVVQLVINYLVLTCDQQNTLESRFTVTDLCAQASSSDLSVEEIKQNINTTISARALVLLAAKTYNKLSLQYDIEQEKMFKDSCFSKVLLPAQMQKIVRGVDNANLRTIEQFIFDNQHQIHSIITSHTLLLNNSHKHRHHHGENIIDHRVRRDIDHVSTKDGNHDNDAHLLDAIDDKLTSTSAGSSLQPLGYNIVNWIRDSILTFKTLNPIQQLKNLFNAYNDTTQTTVYDLDISDNAGCKESQKQDGLVNKFSIVQDINDQICELVEKEVVATKLLQKLCQQLNSVEKGILSQEESEDAIIKMYQEEEDLVIKYGNLQDQKQELYHIKEQIASQESVIESLRGTLNSLNHELAMLNVEDNNLSLYHELPYWNKSLEEDVEVDDDIADQVPIWIRSNHHINVGNLPNSFIGNDRDKNQVLDDSLCDVQGTLSLWNLLMRKKYGVHYNHQHDIMQSEEVNTEYAHRLAYKAYASIYYTSQENIELSGISMVD